MDWSFADKIVCICLNSRQDLYNQSSAVFQKYHIPAQYYMVDKHPKGGKAGCFQSHIEVIRQAYDEGCQNVLIFESDVYPTYRLTPENLKHCQDFIQSDTPWDLFYLGGWCGVFNEWEYYFYPTFKHHNEWIIKGKFAQTHAYLVNRSFMEKVCNLKYHTYQYDSMLMYHPNETYGFQPSLFHQKNPVTDVQLLSIIGGRYDNIIGEMLYYYSRYINFSILDFLIIIGLIIIVLIILGISKNYSFF